MEYLKYIGKAIYPEASGSNGYWYNGTKILDVTTNTHINLIIKNPELFGLDETTIDELYAKYGEKKGTEGKAREEILKLAASNGWIRVRHYSRPYDYWSIQCDSLKLRKDKMKDFCYWAIEHNLMTYHDEVVLLGYNNPNDKEVYRFQQGGVEQLLSESLLESPWSRIVSYIMSGSTFAVISAFRKDSPINGWRKTFPKISSNEIAKLDDEAHQKLKNTIKDSKYGWIELKSVYEGQEEKSLFIPYLPKNLALEIGSEFQQQSIIYKNDDFFGIISTMDYDSHLKGDIELTFNTTHKPGPNGEDILTFNPNILKYANSQLLHGSKHQKDKAFAFVVEHTQMYELTYLTKYDAVKALQENRNVEVWRKVVF